MPKKILIIEDDNNLKECYEVALKDEGYDVESTTNDKAALKELHEKHIDLVILDLYSPRGSGIEYLQKLMRVNRDVKIIINRAYPLYKLDFRTWAADALLTKSTDIGQLKNVVREMLTH